MMKFLTTTTLLALWMGSSCTVEAHQDVLNVHGSGTTNPSKCFWAIMEDFTDQTLHPIRMSYRAVGSSTGIAEFVNNFTATPSSDFGSGDLPLPEETYQGLFDAGVTVIHLPILLGAVSFFHSVPDVDKVDLDACLLARIFQRDLTNWGHEDIVALNPELKGVDLDITVARRVRGSSSTDSITRFLFDACPEFWPEEDTGPLIAWNADTQPCQGSGGMTTCITETEGTIGYIDAGHGIGEGLAEIELKNKDGTIQSSQAAAANNGIAAAEPPLPDTADLDFSGVSLLNRPGEFTWPIVQMTYLYVRTDLSYFGDADEQSLLVAFLKALYDDDYVQQCVEDHGFTLPTQTVRNYALNAIDTLLTVDPASNEWIIESSTLPIEGTGDFVISQKRRTHNEVERDVLFDSIQDLKDQIFSLQGELVDSRLATTRLEEDSFDKDAQLAVALTLGTLSFVMILAMLACAGCRMFGKV